MESESTSQIYSLGYRKWEKKFKGTIYRVLTIALVEAKTALGSRIVKLLIFARVAILVIGIFKLITFGISGITFMLSFDALFGLMMSPTFLPIFAGKTAFLKVFAAMLGSQFSFFDVLLIGWVGSSLISNDREYNSITLYLSRPIRKTEYVIGKYGAVFIYVLSFTWVPTTLYFFTLEILMERSFSQIAFDIVSVYFPALFSGLINGLLIMTLVLSLSSITKRGLYVGMLTAAINPLSILFSQIMRNVLGVDFWYLFSLPICLKIIQLFLIGVSPSDYFASTQETAINLSPISAGICFLFIGVLILIFLYILIRQIRKLELTE